MLTATGARLLANVGIFVLLAHIWGPQPFGRFMFSFVVAGVLVKIVDYGFALQLAKQLGAAPELVRHITGTALKAKLGLTLAAVVCSAGAALLLPSLSSNSLLFTLLMADACINSFALFLNFPLRALRRFDAESRIALSANGLLFVVVVLAAVMNGGPVEVALALVIARLFALVNSWNAFERIAGGAPIMPSGRTKALQALRNGLPFGVHMTVAALSMQVDTIILQHLAGAHAVGLYQAGMRVLVAALVVADSLNSVYTAEMARVSEQPDELRALGTRMTRHLLVLGLLGSTSLLLGGEALVEVLYGSAYSELGTLLPWLGIVLLLRYVGVSYGTLLTLAQKQWLRMAAVTSVLVLNIALNWVLIPLYGLRGAMMASIMSLVALYGVYIVAVRLQLGSYLFDQRSKLLVAGVGPLAWCALQPPSLSPAQIGGGVVLVAVISAMVGLRAAEWTTLTRRVGRALR